MHAVTREREFGGGGEARTAFEAESVAAGLRGAGD